MAWKPTIKQAEFKSGPAGQAKIELSPNKKSWRVTMKTAEGETKNFQGKVADLPDDIQEVIRDGYFKVGMSGDETKIFNITPWAGMYEGEFVRFSARNGEVPAPRMSDGGQYAPYQYFTAILRVIGGDCAGLLVRVTFHYNFGEGKNGELIFTKGGAQAKHTPFLVDFLSSAGLFEGEPMKYADNTLPALEKRLQGADKRFKFVMTKGRVDSFFSPTFDVAEE
jgi:hypothetical protein